MQEDLRKWRKRYNGPRSLIMHKHVVLWEISRRISTFFERQFRVDFVADILLGPISNQFQQVVDNN